MKLLIVAPLPERLGGATNHLYGFLQHLDSARIDAAIAFIGPGSFEREVAELGFRTHIVPAARVRQVGKTFRAIRGLTRILRSEQPDLILGWGLKGQILAAPAALLVRPHGSLAWLQTDLPTRRLDYKLATLLPGKAVVCVSQYVARAQARQWPRRPTIVVYPGIESPTQVPADELEALRASLAIPAGRTVIGTVGRLEPRKRQDLLIRALADLRQRGRDVHGLVVGGDAWNGDPTYGRSVRELVNKRDLAEAVTFTGYVPDAIPYIQLMDLYAHTCPVEAFGLALAEAMGSGIACVVVGTAGPAEIVEDGRSGVVVAQLDPTPLGEAIERLLEDDALRKGLAESGRQRQLDQFSAAHMTEQLEDRLLELATAVPPR